MTDHFVTIPRITPQNVLAHMRADDGLYILGCLERRVTLHSQQIRALNLVYSLYETGVTKPGETILIVGGGVAGVTAAAGAARLGINVKLIEREEDLLHLQRNNAKRWIHPNIYDWPAAGSMNAETAVPLLGWRAGAARDVARQILDAFDALPKDERDRIEFHPNAEVRNLGRGPQRQVFWFAKRNHDARVSAVILAIGFGPERDVDGIEFPSYWQDDPLDQSPTNWRRILVSGTGDGGLIEVLRARLRDFRHDGMLADLLGAESLGPVEAGLLGIEKRALDAEQRERGSGRELLHCEYKKLSEEYQELLTRTVDAQLGYRLRDNVTVVLNGGGATPFSLGASILNRFLISRLYFTGKIDYRPGALAKPIRGPNGYEVKFGIGKPGTFDRVVWRHGPAGVLATDFEDIWKRCGSKLRDYAELDQTRWPIYGNAFNREPSTVASGTKVTSKAEPDDPAPPRQHGPTLATYLARLREKVGYVQLAGDHERRPIQDVFVELEITPGEIEARAPNRTSDASEDHVEGSKKRALEIETARRRHSPWEQRTEIISVEDLSSVARRAVIVGAAGSGKSTMLRHIAFKAAGARLGNDKHVIPLWLPRLPSAGEVKNDPPVVLARRALEALGLDPGQSPAFDSLVEAITNGQSLILIDGVDEASRTEQKYAGGADGWLNKLEGSILLASRPLDTGHLQRFSTLHLHGIPSIAAEEMLTKYFPDEAWVPVLIEKLRDLPDGYFWLETPVLLGLAATLYRGQKRLPDSLTDLYDQAIGRLLRQRDLHEDDLGSEKRNALRDFARRMLVPKDRIPRIVFDRKELDYDNVEFFLRSGLFEGNEQLRFTHLTLGERLAAESNLDLVEERSRLRSMSVAAIEGNALEVLPMAHAIQAPDALVAATADAREHDLSDHRLLRLVLRAIGYGGAGVVEFCKTHADQIIELVASRLDTPSGRFGDAERALMDAAERAFLVLRPFVDAEQAKKALGRVLDGSGEAAAEAHTMTWILGIYEPAPRVSYFEATINRQARALVRIFPDPEKVMELTRGNWSSNHADAACVLGRFPEYRALVMNCAENPDPYVRRIVLEALAPHSEAERYLREAFTDSKDEIRMLAVQTLGETPDRRAKHMERLRAALFDPAPRVQAAAIDVLADDNDTRPVLRSFLRGELDPLKTGHAYFLQEALVRALANDTESFDDIERHLLDLPKNWFLVDYFTEVYAVIARHSQWRTWFIKRLSAEDVTESEVHAVADFPEAKAPLLSLLSNSNERVVAAAIRALGKQGVTGTQFVDFLHNENEQIRIAAIEALGADQASWPLLHSFLAANASEWEQRTAINALTADTSAVDKFEALLNSSDVHNVRTTAIDALSQSEDGRVRLRSHFYARRSEAVQDDQNRGIHEDIPRAHIVTCLKDDPDAATLIEDALNDPDTDVQQAAVEALAEKPAFRERFKKMFYAPETDYGVWQSLTNTLIDDSDIQQFFAGVLASTDNGYVRFAAFRYLIDRPPARDALEALFDAPSTSDEERSNMVWPLARNRGFVPRLRKIITADQPVRFRGLVLAVLEHDQEIRQWVRTRAENAVWLLQELAGFSSEDLARVLRADWQVHPIVTRHLHSSEFLDSWGPVLSLGRSFSALMSVVSDYEPAIARLVELLDHKLPRVAQGAMRALGKYEPVRGRLIEALRAKDDDIRKAAADALRHVPEVRSLFRDLLADHDDGVRTSAIGAVVADRSDEAIQALRHRIAAEPKDELRFQILEGIPSDSASIGVLRERLHNDLASTIRKRCARLLSPSVPMNGIPLTLQPAIKRILTMDRSLEPVVEMLRAFIQKPSHVDLDANVDVAEVLLAYLCLQMVEGSPGELSERNFIGETQHPIDRLSAPGSVILIRIAMDVSDLPRERSVRPTHNLIETWNRAKHLVAADPPSIFLACADVEFEHLQPPALEPGEVRWGPTFFGFRIGTNKTASVADDISASSGGVGAPALGGASASPGGRNKGGGAKLPRSGGATKLPRSGGATKLPRSGGAKLPRSGGAKLQRGAVAVSQRGGPEPTHRGGPGPTHRGGPEPTHRGDSIATPPRAISKPTTGGAPKVDTGMAPIGIAQPKPIERTKLSANLIHDVHRAAIKMGLANSRQTLLGGLDPAIGAQIPTMVSPLEQILQDLQFLNAIGRLRDGSIPLRHWLEVALTLTNLRLESQVFEAALQILSE